MLMLSMAITTRVSMAVARAGDLKQTMRIERRKVNTSGMQKEMKSTHTQTTWRGSMDVTDGTMGLFSASSD